MRCALVCCANHRGYTGRTLPAIESDLEKGHAVVVQLVIGVLTLRDISRRSADQVRGPKWLWRIVGTAGEIADELQARFEGGAADGFNVMPSWFPGELDAFATLVVPELQRRGLFRKDYEGRTLREHLGLKRPI